LLKVRVSEPDVGVFDVLPMGKVLQANFSQLPSVEWPLVSFAIGCRTCSLPSNGT